MSNHLYGFQIKQAHVEFLHSLKGTLPTKAARSDASFDNVLLTIDRTGWSAKTTDRYVATRFRTEHREPIDAIPDGTEHRYLLSPDDLDLLKSRVITAKPAQRSSKPVWIDVSEYPDEDRHSVKISGERVEDDLTTAFELDNGRYPKVDSLFDFEDGEVDQLMFDVSKLNQIMAVTLPHEVGRSKAKRDNTVKITSRTSASGMAKHRIQKLCEPVGLPATATFEGILMGINPGSRTPSAGV